MKNRYIILILLVVSVFPLIDLFHPGLPVTHDGQDHVARIANFFNSLTEGNILPRWAGNLNWGYGHPILMFLYPLPSYVASIFRWIGYSFVDSTKLVFAFAYIASILTMYLWSSVVFNRKVGILTAILYGFAPYRFVDLYVRGAIGEHVAFIFPPLILFFIFRIGQNYKQKNYPYKKNIFDVIRLALSIAGMILSHNAIALMFMPILLIYSVFTGVGINKKLYTNYFMMIIIGFILGFGLSAFFWIPAFFEGKYTLRNIVTKGDYKNRFVPWSWFIYSEWNYGQGNQFSKSLGIIQIFGIMLSIWQFMRAKERETRLFIGAISMIFIVSLFMMTPASQCIWDNISILQKFQFPWRFLNLTVFCAAILSGWSINVFIENIFQNAKSNKYISLGIIILLSIIITSPFWKAKNYLIKADQFYSGIYNGTTDTGESSPIWSVRFMEKRPNGGQEIIQGNGTVSKIFRNTTLHEYKILSDTKLRILENTLYFPGWEVSVNGSKIPIEFQDQNYRGLITYWLNPGENTVKVQFFETKLRKIADQISIITMIIIIIIAVISKIYAFKSNQKTNISI